MLCHSTEFTLSDAREVLDWLRPGDATDANCSKLVAYLDEIPAPQDFETYALYHDQIGPSARMLRMTDRMDAELWLWALLIRALSFEVETGIEGPVKELVRTAAPQVLDL